MVRHLVSLILAPLILLLASPSPTHAWGQAGHAIVATIAQSLLHPAVRTHLCTILPPFTSYTSPYPRKDAPHQHCHLATLASWPDTAKWRMPWSGHLHYVNPVNDEPPKTCTYGEDGFTDQQNVLTALVNYTRQLRDSTGDERDVALRFVTHLVGDLHQPLHLTGRARGGNDVWVRYEGRKARLHSVWDSQIINTQVRSLQNYTAPLPSLPFESALRNQVYDPYIRWIMAEGIAIGKPMSSPPGTGWWEDEWSSWAHCPQISRQDFADEPTNRVDDTDLPLCPMAWSRPMHALVCQYAFASPVPAPDDFDWPVNGSDLNGGEEDESVDEQSKTQRRRRRRRRPYPRRPLPQPGKPLPSDGPQPYPPPPDLPELADDYLSKINVDKVVQKQLALAGVRLAAIVNSVLLDEALASQYSKARAVVDDDASWMDHVWAGAVDLVKKKVTFAGML